MSLFIHTFRAWREDKAPQLAASTAYYTVFSLAPFLIIVISLAGIIFDSETAEQFILEQLQFLLGQQGADAVESMLQASRSDFCCLFHS